MEWAILPLRRYAQFGGRSRRKEYWSFLVLAVILFLILSFLEGRLGLFAHGLGGLLTLIFQLLILLPMLAVGARRLHDSGRGGWWLLIGYAPLLASTLLPLAMPVGSGLAMVLLVAAGLGMALLLILMLLEGESGPNAYGPDPRAVAP